jgi:hypothetical protein
MHEEPTKLEELIKERKPHDIELINPTIERKLSDPGQV